MSLSLYRTKEFGSSSRLSHSAAQHADYSFIALLALAQRLKIPFLPVIWQTLLGDLGRGGQAIVSQALANLQTSFAFKRFRGDSTGNMDENTPFQAVINEISMLSHRAIRDHPYIITLEGICWDIPTDGSEVWPVLVFEKSIHGDLHEFVKAGRGRSLSNKEKLKLYTDIGIAIRDMHSNNIIHGDIKPQNVLIFPDEHHSFIAKMADFGFSIGFQDENDRIFLPESPPWNAPEYHKRYFSPEDSKRMDIYSFGLLCFWFLFATSGQLPLAQWMQYENAEFISFEGTSESLDILTRLKENEDDELIRWIVWLINGQNDFDADERENLQQFFHCTLVRKPDQRNMNHNSIMPYLNPHREISQSVVQIDTDFLLPEEDFRIKSSILEFYRADFRLRSHIAECLLSISHNIPTPLIQHISPEKAAFQLAICYEIGFGVPRNKSNGIKLLEKSSRSWGEFENEVLSLKSAIFMPRRQTGIFWKIVSQGHIPGIDLPQYYRERNLLDKAESTYVQEIHDLHQELGDTHEVFITVQSSLASLYTSQGRWDDALKLQVQEMETSIRQLGPNDPDTLISISKVAPTYSDQGRWNDAEKLKVQVMETSIKELGPDHPDTLSSIGSLAATYSDYGRWDEAQNLQVQVIEMYKRQLGPNHISTLRSIGHLAGTYADQGRWDDAEQLQVQIIETRKRQLGPDHPDTFRSIGDLAVTYLQQGRWDDAEKLLVQVIEISVKQFGPDHPFTLTSMGNLAATYAGQGRWDEAEKLQVKVMETRKRQLGPDHPSTLKIIVNLAATYSDQECWDDAEKLLVEVVETSKKQRGPDHPDTLTSMGNLALTYLHQERWVDGEKLQVQVMETSTKQLGPDHPDTLRSMANLAVTYYDQGRWEKAEKLEIQVMETRKRQLGPDHPDTLTSIASLAATYYDQGRWEEANELQDEVTEIRGKAL